MKMVNGEMSVSSLMSTFYLHECNNGQSEHSGNSLVQ